MARYPQAILVSCEIPWDKHEQLLEDVFRREIRHILQEFNHLYIFGTAGEGYAVDTPRFQQIVRVFYKETRGPDVHPMVGVIALSTATIVERLVLAPMRWASGSFRFRCPLGVSSPTPRC